MGERALIASGFFLFSGSVLLLCVRRKRDRHRLWRQRVTFKKISKKCAPVMSFYFVSLHVCAVLRAKTDDHVYGKPLTFRCFFYACIRVCSSDLGHCFGLDIGTSRFVFLIRGSRFGC